MVSLPVPNTLRVDAFSLQGRSKDPCFKLLEKYIHVYIYTQVHVFLSPQVPIISDYFLVEIHAAETAHNHHQPDKGKTSNKSSTDTVIHTPGMGG